MAESETELVIADGRCLCGKTRYHVEGQSFGIIYCHCQRCRKHTGAPVVGFLIFESGRINWQSGKDSLGSFDTEATTRAFCRDCGSSMPTPQRDDTKMHNIMPGNILDMMPPGGRWHVYTGSGCPWYKVAAEIPHWERLAPEFKDRDLGLGILERHREADRMTGSCLCGDVTFAAQAPLGMMNCHCSRCRLSRASAHATNLFVASENFEWRSGEDRIETYKLPDAARFSTAFCRDCGSLVPSVSGPRCNIPAGCLDSDPGIAPRGHIFVSSKAPWFAIEDNLPQWQERPA